MNKRTVLKIASRVLLVLVLLVVAGGVFASPVRAAPADVYWVGDGGNWSDAATHWAAASGGAPNVANLPTSTSNVHFDANSFSIGGQTVTIDATAYCLDMDWTGATNTPSLTGSGIQFRTYGDITFIEAMNVGTLKLYFYGVGVQNLTSAGNSIGGVVYNYGATLTLLDDAIFVSFYITSGNLVTNNHSLSVSVFDSRYVSTRTFTFGSSIINVSIHYKVTGTNLTVTPNTATINCSGKFEGGDIATYHIVNLTGATSTISGSNTFAELNFNPAIAQVITFTDGTTQTVTDADWSGTAGNIHTLQGTGVAGWTCAKAGGSFLEFDYLDLSYSTASPVDTWSYGTHSTIGADVFDWGVPYFYISIDGVEQDAVPITGISVPDTANVWEFQNAGTSFPYADYHDIEINGVDVLRFAPVEMLTGNVLPNEDNPGTHDGTIIWGTNTDIDIHYGAMEGSGATDVSADVAPGVEMPGADMPINWYGGGDISGMPLYDSFNPMAIAAGIPIVTVYLWLIFGISVMAMLILVIFIRSAVLGCIGMLLVLFWGSEQNVLATWVPFIVLISQIGIMFLYQQFGGKTFT